MLTLMPRSRPVSRKALRNGRRLHALGDAVDLPEQTPHQKGFKIRILGFRQIDRIALEEDHFRLAWQGSKSEALQVHQDFPERYD